MANGNGGGLEALSRSALLTVAGRLANLLAIPLAAALMAHAWSEYRSTITIVQEQQIVLRELILTMRDVALPRIAALEGGLSRAQESRATRAEVERLERRLEELWAMIRQIEQQRRQ